MIAAVTSGQVESGLVALVLVGIGVACLCAARIDFAGWRVALSDPAVAKWEELADRPRYFDEQTTKPLDWSDFPELRELRLLGRPVEPTNRDGRWAA